MSDQTPNFLDAVFSNFDEDVAAAQVIGAEEIVRERERERDAAETALTEAKDDLTAKRDVLDAYRRWNARRTGDTFVSYPFAREAGNANGSGSARTGRESVLAVVRSGGADREWTITDVAQALGVGEEAHHAIQVSLGRLVRLDKKLTRPRKGRYKLPSDPVTAAPEEEGELRLATGSQEGPGWAD